MHQILTLFSLWTLFSIDLLGLALYPSYLAIPLLLVKSKLKYPKSMIILILGFFLLSLMAITTKIHLALDFVRGLVMISYFLYLKTFLKRDKIFDIIDISVTILVIYGCFQYIAFLTGHQEYGLWLHKQIGNDLYGGPYDNRSGILRVSSLTFEPSYFAFTCGIYLFITKRKLVRLICLLGYFISFSLISLYGALGVIGFCLWKKILKMNLFSYMLLIFFAHVFFVYTYYSNVVDLEIGPTFAARYAGLLKYLQSSIVELIIGVSDIGSEMVTVKRPFSNISSLVVNFGIVGVLAYTHFLSKIGRKNDMAALAIYLYGFNYYYLTGWPSFVIFLYMIYANEKSTGFSNHTLLQFRKNYPESTDLNQRTNLSSSRNNLHR